MAYVCEVSSEQRLYLDCSGTDTIVTLASSSAGQQQQSSSRFSTGAWTAPPHLFRTPHGIGIKITTATGDRFLQLQDSCLSITAEVPETEVHALPLQSVTPGSDENAESLPPLKPMQPMQPMQMGNMQMNLNPMEMRMGDMTLRMGESIATPAASHSQFCSQCGTAVKMGDRFCTHCGHSLTGQSLS